MPKGRKSKSGKREPNGRISRKGEVVTFDHGSDKARDKFSVYGQDGSDAIGRAYVVGLLNFDGGDADARLNTGRMIFRAYWPMFVVGRCGSALADHVPGLDTDHIDPEERQRRIEREKDLTEKLRRIDRKGRGFRRAFDQLCIDMNPDCGPAWLDRLIWARKHRRELDPVDVGWLNRALAAVDAISNAPVRRILTAA